MISPLVSRPVPSVLVGLVFTSTGAVAVESMNAPRPIPLTRPEMKAALEDMKSRTPRIPLPELTDADRERLGERGSSYEGRLRYHYLNTEGQSGPGGQGRGEGRGAGGGGFGRDNDPDMTLDYAFKVQLFWIVSRTNNCQYCLGHQESKLLGAGMTEDEIAALDGDWSQHTPAQRAAYQFARKITYEPYRLADEDISRLRAFYTDKQILEMILSVAGNNSINRWKEGAGIPQSTGGGNFGTRRPAEAGQPRTAPTERPAGRVESHSYLTATSAKFQSQTTRVAPVSGNAEPGQTSSPTVALRPPLESPAEVATALQRTRTRTARLPLVEESAARQLVPDGLPSGPLPNWVRLVATFPTSAPARIRSMMAAEENNDLSPRLRAQLSWIIARQDRAWYATGLAERQLRGLGWSPEQIASLDGDWSAQTPAEKSLFTVARKLATTPVVLTDADVAEAVRLAGPRQVVQVISYTTSRASFNRITEAAGLPLESE